mmetsp:Transcript_7835/g.23567  ORF Transcript_7835/g.23567 Transcript_7835/m.23567 type:complete len:251 (-) Transcript_7835:1386-2138(-)
MKGFVGDRRFTRGCSKFWRACGLPASAASGACGDCRASGGSSCCCCGGVGERAKVGVVGRSAGEAPAALPLPLGLEMAPDVRRRSCRARRRARRAATSASSDLIWFSSSGCTTFAASCRRLGTPSTRLTGGSRSNTSSRLVSGLSMCSSWKCALRRAMSKGVRPRWSTSRRGSIVCAAATKSGLDWRSDVRERMWSAMSATTAPWWPEYAAACSAQKPTSTPGSIGSGPVARALGFAPSSPSSSIKSTWP